MPQPFFSVVIDNHNYGRFLREAIESVLSQAEAKETELIVVDDGSTDDSRRIIASYGSRIRPVLQDRKGQATAFNQGFSEARGEVVCLLDADDYWLPGKLAALGSLFDDSAVGAAQHWLQDVGADKAPLPQGLVQWPPRYALEDFLQDSCRFTATSGIAFRRSILQRALPIPRELFYYLDDFLMVRSLFFAQIANVNRFLGVHRVHGGNWCAGGYEDPRKLEVDFRMREIFSENLKSWLFESGRQLSPAFVESQRREVARRRILHAALTARPAEAWDLWVEEARRARSTGFGLFRLGTLLLAVASPALYFAFYSLYTRAGRLRDLRLRLLPER